MKASLLTISLLLLAQTTMATDFFEQEPNDTLATANQAPNIEIGQALNGTSIAAAQDLDYWNLGFSQRAPGIYRHSITDYTGAFSYGPEVISTYDGSIIRSHYNEFYDFGGLTHLPIVVEHSQQGGGIDDYHIVYLRSQISAIDLGDFQPGTFSIADNDAARVAILRDNGDFVGGALRLDHWNPTYNRALTEGSYFFAFGDVLVAEQPLIHPDGLPTVYSNVPRTIYGHGWEGSYGGAHTELFAPDRQVALNWRQDSLDRDGSIVFYRVNVVPEPTSSAALFAGAAGLMAAKRKKIR